MRLARKISNSSYGTAILTVFALFGSAVASLSAEEADRESTKSAFQWEAQTIKQKLSATAKSREAWFFLTNQSTQTRKILKIESDCDCITTALDRRQLHPGESAVLVTTFHPGTRVGSVTKSIRVISQGKKATPDTDSLEWHLQIEPPFKMQRINHEKSGPEERYRIESKLTPPPRLKVPDGLSGILQLQATESAGRWLLTIDLPTRPQAAENSALYLIALFPDGLRKHVPVQPTPR